MYAVFRSGGKQYRAEEGDVLRLEKIDGEEGASLEFQEVLIVGEGTDVRIGSPVLSGTTVSARIVRQGKSAKVPVVKFKRRQNYLRQGTHRQQFTDVEITSIGAAKAGSDDKPAAKKKTAKKVTAKKTAKKTAAKKKTAKKTSAKKASAKKTSAKKTTSKKKTKKKAKKKTS